MASRKPVVEVSGKGRTRPTDGHYTEVLTYKGISGSGNGSKFIYESDGEEDRQNRPDPRQNIGRLYIGRDCLRSDPPKSVRVTVEAI